VQVKGQLGGSKAFGGVCLVSQRVGNPPPKFFFGGTLCFFLSSWASAIAHCIPFLRTRHLLDCQTSARRIRLGCSYSAVTESTPPPRPGWQSWPEGATEKDVLSRFVPLTDRLLDLVDGHPPVSGRLQSLRQCWCV
jgi:hypothetical protein